MFNDNIMIIIIITLPEQLLYTKCHAKSFRDIVLLTPQGSTVRIMVIFLVMGPMFVSLQNSHVETLTPNRILSGAGDFAPGDRSWR